MRTIYCLSLIRHSRAGAKVGWHRPVRRDLLSTLLHILYPPVVVGYSVFEVFLGIPLRHFLVPFGKLVFHFFRIDFLEDVGRCPCLNCCSAPGSIDDAYRDLRN